MKVEEAATLLKARQIPRRDNLCCSMPKCLLAAAYRVGIRTPLCADHLLDVAKTLATDIQRAMGAKYGDAFACYRSHLEWSRRYGKKQKRIKCPTRLKGVNVKVWEEREPVI